MKSRIVNNNEIKYINFDILNKYSNLIAAYSTRIGGISEDCFSSMNLSFSRGDLKENVLKNYEIFSNALNIPYKKMVLSSQYHNTNILKVNDSHIGMGIIKNRNFNDIDGLVTDKKNIPLVTFYADCVPIYFFDSKKNIIGIAHSGWKGTVSKISDNMVDIFLNDYNSKVEDILIVIGPSICKSCFEVDIDVIEKINELSFDIKEFYDYKKDKNKYYLDLPNINRKILIEKGISEKNIQVSELCTKCNLDLFFSHRGHKEKRGSQIGIMMLK